MLLLDLGGWFVQCILLGGCCICLSIDCFSCGCFNSVVVFIRCDLVWCLNSFVMFFGCLVYVYCFVV